MAVVRTTEKLSGDSRVLRQRTLLRCALSLQSNAADKARAQEWSEVVAAAWHEARSAVDALLLSGVEDTLSALKEAGFLVVVCSNEKTYIRSSKIHRLVDHIVIAKDSFAKKPAAGIFRAILEKTGVHATQVVHVGSSWHKSIVSAVSAGCYAFWLADDDKARHEDTALGHAVPSLPPEGAQMYCGRLDNLHGLIELLPEARLRRVLRFMQETNGLKHIDRTVRISKTGRFESTAEHSWHLALMFMALEDDLGLPADLDRLKLLKMLLVHDLPEVYAGDTPLYATIQRNSQGQLMLGQDGPVMNESKVNSKKDKEQRAANALFALLPRGVGEKFSQLWAEFEANQTMEARYAKALDKLHPLLQNSVSAGTDYISCGATYESEVALLKKHVSLVDPALAKLGGYLLEDAKAEGWIRQTEACKQATMEMSLSASDFRSLLCRKGDRGLVLDIDETLAATNMAWFARLTELFGNPEGSSVDELVRKYHLAQNVPFWQSREALDWMDRSRSSAEAQDGLPLIPGAKEGVRALMQIVPVVGYLTVRPDSTNKNTLAWLKACGFPELPLVAKPEEVSFADGNKWKASILHTLWPEVWGIVDDNPKVPTFAGGLYRGRIFLFGHSICKPEYEHAVPCSTWPAVVEAVRSHFTTESKQQIVSPSKRFYANTQICLAQSEDRARLAKFVIDNHLALSDDCPQEWHSQFTDVSTDFPHLLDSQLFAQGKYCLAVQEGKLVAAAGITPKKKKKGLWSLTALSVAKVARRQGLGEHLARLAIHDARMSGVSQLELVTLLELMEPAWRLYEKLGFRRVEEEVARQSPRRMTVLRYVMDL
eukprot:gb/GEZN01001536.1/.p1 GENE.gb/GEZN01001536.1/~~gb/GEZN01001536.1/.p1  ORF type:complete len:933 (-),score=99.74 gb/GEZN01001536.1/:190-2667(-)